MKISAATLGRPDRLTLLLWVSAASLFATLPHSVEDFANGTAARFGLAVLSAAFGLAALFAAQLLGTGLAMRGRRTGYLLLGAVGLVWVAGALLDHGSELLNPGWRSGLISVLLVWAILLTQGAILVLAGLGLRRQ